MHKDALIALDDGSLFYGYAESKGPFICSELVFTTAMTGYQQSLSDPSYEGQILAFTFPHIGATGICEDQLQSRDSGPCGIIVRDLSSSFFLSPNQDLKTYLQKRSIPCISGIDTRRLALAIRSKNKTYACVMTQDIDERMALKYARSYTKVLSQRQKQAYICNHDYKNKEGFCVVVIDYGIKKGIIETLSQHGCCVVMVPASDPRAIEKYEADGYVISNGPGDPRNLDLDVIRVVLSRKVPVFGICLGHQLLALSYGAKVYKMNHGQHGINHAVIDIEKNRFILTSQNHDFAVEDKSLPESCSVTHRSCVDGSVAGFRSIEDQVITFQGHPEGEPGPRDIAYIVQEFVSMMRKCRAKKK